MGRGTMRSMVEGLFGTGASLQDQQDCFFDIAIELARRNPQGPYSNVLQPYVPPLVSLRIIAEFVCDAINLDPQPRRGTVKIQHIGANRVLPPKLQPLWPRP